MRRISKLLHHALLPCAAALVAAALTEGVHAQITSTQQSAIRSSCRSDFMAKCSGVTPGGKDALACLQKNVASLSGACKTAVSATLPAPAQPAQAAPAPAAPAPAAPVTAAPAAPAPAAPAAATAAPPKPAAAPIATTTPPRPKIAKAVKTPAQATAAPMPTAAPAAAAPPPPPAATAPAPHTPKAPIVMTAVIGRSCLRDLIRHCRGVGVGDGQKIACLTDHADSLTVVCRTAMKITTPLR